MEVEYATMGAMVGGAAAAAVGTFIMAGVLPTIGPVLAAGPVAVSLLNALGGAAVVGLAGGLIGSRIHTV